MQQALGPSYTIVGGDTGIPGPNLFAYADAQMLAINSLGTVVASYPSGTSSNSHAPIVRDNTVFYASGYGVSHFLLTITKKEAEWVVKEG